MTKKPSCFHKALLFSCLIIAANANAELLHDNGDLITHHGAGTAGGDVSAVQTNIGLSTFGFDASSSGARRISDDFTISSRDSEWNIATIVLYAYQTPPGTSYSAATLRIWDAQPGSSGASVVWGDTSTNLLSSSSPTQTYRAADTNLTDANRRITLLTLDTSGLTLPTGDYWLDFDISASNSSQVPPITILDQTTTGNAIQHSAGEWQPLLDSGTNTPQAVPFEINGTRQAAITPPQSTAQPVPLLSPFNLAFIALMLLSFGYKVLRRR